MPTKLTPEEKQKQWEEKQDQAMRDRTAEYDPQLVEAAKRLGINPDNFEDEQDLIDAINIREQE